MLNPRLSVSQVSFFEMGLARVERAAYRLGGNRSIHLSYSPNVCHYSKLFCRLDSYKISAAVIETFKDSTVGCMGIFTTRSATSISS
jgi:hypothetical protein